MKKRVFGRFELGLAIISITIFVVLVLPEAHVNDIELSGGFEFPHEVALGTDWKMPNFVPLGILRIVASAVFGVVALRVRHFSGYKNYRWPRASAIFTIATVTFLCLAFLCSGLYCFEELGVTWRTYLFWATIGLFAALLTCLTVGLALQFLPTGSKELGSAPDGV